MYPKKSLLILLLLTIISSAAFGQSITELLQQTTRAYLDANDLSIDVRVHTFASPADHGTLLGNGMIRKSGSSYYSKFLSDELIINNKCTVVLDHDAKTITWYTPEDDKKEWKKAAGHLPDMDSLYALADSLVYKGVVNGQRDFLFYSKEPLSSIRLTEVLIDEQTHFISRVVYYYHDNTPDDQYDIYKVVIDYQAISTAALSETVFSEKKYIAYSKGQPVLAPAYSKYKLFIEK